MELRPRNKRINYGKTSKKQSSPVRFPRDCTTERNLRPRKLTSYQDPSSSFQLSGSDSEFSISDGNQSYFSKQNKKRKISTRNSRIPLSILSNYDATDDEDEYRSIREENTARRFNILKNMGLINCTRKVGCNASKVTPKCIHSDYVTEENSDVMNANEEKSELASISDSENDSEENYTTQRKRRIAEHCRTLETMTEEEKMSMVTSTPIVLLHRIPG